ncbi:MAG: DMT family transporter [Ignavibacteria bacterium]|nr:DMT family transporter [Ignavibacteria bacterium]
MGNRSVAKGVISALTGLFFLSLIAVCVKLAGKTGAHLGWIVFMQYTAAFALALIISAKEKFRNVHSGILKMEIVRGAAGVTSFFCFAIAMAEIPMVDASLLQNTAPIFIPIIGMIWLKDAVDRRIWLGVLIGFIGIVLIIKPDGSLFKPGDLIGLASGISLALGYVAMRVITKSDGFKTIIFYFALTAFVISLPVGIIFWSNPPIEGWLYSLASGVLLVSYLFMQQYSYKHAEPAKLSPFNYFVVIFVGLLDWWLFGHVPDLLTLIGIVTVSIGGIIAIIKHEEKNKELKHGWHS